MRKLTRVLRALPLLLASPLLLAIAFLLLLVTDALWLLFGKRRTTSDAPLPGDPAHRAATVVIPNWNGRELLEKYLPPLLEATRHNPQHEILVVDNGSTDGSADFVRQRFPTVNVLTLERNLGFGGGSNAGFRAARNDIVVLLNSDMRVEADFLAPLLEGFTDEKVFSVACQIFFSDPDKVREETGLTEAWWANGALRVSHRNDPAITDPYPCFYGGGGSCAFDRRKLLELGGFDSLLAPFYLEDTDLGFRAWKRGWKVLYQPRSIVYHEHRGTIGKRFSPAYIQAVLKKNFLLFTWKNIHEFPRLTSHFVFTFCDAILSLLLGDSPERSNCEGIWRAFAQLPHALASRWRARERAVVDDTEAFLRPLGGYFRDRFAAPMPPDPQPLRVLFVSPYRVCPPTHGGGVFMNHTIRYLAQYAEVHLLAMLDYEREREAHEEIAPFCASMELRVRKTVLAHSYGSLLPHAVREFADRDFQWLLHRQVYTRNIDVLQLEYTALAQYGCRFQRLVSALFEHDVYFQSIGRALAECRPFAWKFHAAFEYLCALRYELRTLPRFDHIQVCSRENGDYLLSFLPALAPKIEAGLRAAVDTCRYTFNPAGREPCTLLFLGSFRHLPNQTALTWFVREVYPKVLARRPEARLMIAGTDLPPVHGLPSTLPIELLGFVPDVNEPLSRYAVFICPILSGSGVRVKLLEAFAAGMPVVSTQLGAEGVARKDGEFCALADDPETFAARTLALFDDPAEAAAMATRARREVERNWDSAVLTERLADSFRRVLKQKRGTADALAPAPASTSYSA